MAKSLLKKIINKIERVRKGDIQDNIFKEFERAFRIEQAYFPDKIILPKKYGEALPERVIELLFARLSYRPGSRILDVAHANSMACHLKMLESLPGPRHLTGIDIAEPVYDTSPLYEKSLIGDITNTLFTESSFDLIWCISALEHFGMDNSGYTDNFSIDNNVDVIALKEMLRILTVCGNLLITVPFGKFENHGWFKNYSSVQWQNLLDSARNVATIKEYYFKHTEKNGWSVVNADQLESVGYFDQKNSGAAGLAAAYITKMSLA